MNLTAIWKKYGLVIVSALGVLALVTLIGINSGRAAAHRSEAESLKRQLGASKIELVEAKKQLAAAQAKTDTVVKTVTRRVTAVASADSTLTHTLTQAQLALNDSAATIAQLRVALGTTVRDASLYRAEVRTLTDSVSVLVATLAEERATNATAEAKSLRTLNLAYQTIAAYEKAATCKILFVTCPTRTQTAVVVGLAGLVAGIAIAK